MTSAWIPANLAAREIGEILKPLLVHTHGQYISWENDLAIVLCNWQVLYGRGPCPVNEGNRILERIYVG